jgi:lysophospholipase L1-like esterase
VLVKAVSVVFGFFAALFVAAIAYFTTGSLVLAILALVAVLATAIYGLVAPRGVVTVIGLVMVGLFVASGAFIAWQTVTVVSALTGTEGPADPADPVYLAAAEEKIDDIDDSGGFRLELTEDEIQAVIQDGLEDPDSPLRRVTIDILDPDADDKQGTLTFTGEFKEGNIDVDGAVTATLDAGAVEIEVVEVDLGMLTMPGLAEGAIEDLVESVADLNTTLAENQAAVQSITIGDDRVVITGVQGDGELVTSESLLAGLQEQANAISGGVTPPPEVLGPGVIGGTEAEGATYYVALGDSLAANVGVDDARDGYVSRLHNWLQNTDGASYGLRNYGVSGETSGTLIRGGQLDEALAFMADPDNEITYVTIDIGANDLLGHLGSPDCSESLETPACRDRIASTFVTYEENMVTIFDELVAAAPDATIVFMKAYNPFSLGFGAAIGLEATSNQVLSDFNDLAADLAEERGILVADAFTPMQNTAAATTHMLDPQPDIHPYPIGFDILAQSVVGALGG